VSSGTLRRVALVRTDVSEELSASFMRDLALSRAIYNPTLLSPFFPLIPLCILNSEFHSSFLSHLVFLRSVRRLLVTASVFPSSPILVTLINKALSSSGTSILTRATRHNIPEDTILHVKLCLKESRTAPFRPSLK
jgi:hypothetical protein